MFKRVTADLFFTREDEAEDFYHDCQLALEKSVTINPGQPNQEQGTISIQDCYHDQNPNLPCDIIDDDHTP